jgi:hypothetical protein
MIVEKKSEKQPGLRHGSEMARHVEKMSVPLDRFLPRKLVLELTGLSSVMLRRELRAGQFPPPVEVSRERKLLAGKRDQASAESANGRQSVTCPRAKLHHTNTEVPRHRPLRLALSQIAATRTAGDVESGPPLLNLPGESRVSKDAVHPLYRSAAMFVWVRRRRFPGVIGVA